MTSLAYRPSALISAFRVFAAAAVMALAPFCNASEAFFPLMAWNWAPADPAALRRMHDCGLTVAGFVAARDLDLCHEAGLKAIVSDPRASKYDWRNVAEEAARKNVTELARETAAHPAVYGYYLIDEPNAELFPGLATVAGLVRELAPGKWPYINLFPNYASPEQLGAPNYEAYLERFAAVCKPTTLSYDHYALMENGSLRDGYWQNLEQMRAKAKERSVPFWNIVLAVAHFTYREPTAADLRFQVYSTLAYGGRGIAYFTYFAPQVGNYRAAAVDQFGAETPTWQHLQNVNRQIQKLAPALLQLRSDEVYHTGALPAGTRAPGPSSLVQSMGDGSFVIGDFTHNDGSRYVMIVNTDFTKSRYCRPRFRAQPRLVQMVSPYTGQHIDFAGEHQWLAAGQGVLLKLLPAER